MILSICLTQGQEITATNINGYVCFNKSDAFVLYKEHNLLPELISITNSQNKTIKYLTEQILCYTNIIEIDGKLHDFGVLVNNGFELGHEKHVLEGLPVSI